MVAGGSIHAGPCLAASRAREARSRLRPFLPFGAGDTVTFGVPWLSAHHELLLTFPVDGLAEVNRAAGRGGIADIGDNGGA